MRTIAALLALLDGAVTIAAVLLCIALAFAAVFVIVLFAKEPSVAWFINTVGAGLIALVVWVLWPAGQNKETRN